LLFENDTKLSNLVVVVEFSVDHLQKNVILNQSRRRNQVSIRVTTHLFDSYLHKSSAEKAIMIHEKIVSKDKQSIAFIEAELSSRSMREARRESVISTDEIEDEFDAASTSYHIQNLDQLKY
jgi:lipopolysaccharide biosynthesis regulator YciM